MQVKAIPFKYNTAAVTEKQFDEHIKLYKNYINKINQITDDLSKNPMRSEANSTYSKYRGLKKGETFSLDGVILHELYFQNMTKQETNISPKTNMVLENYFESFENWRKDFHSAAMAARGWAILIYDQRTSSYRNILLDAHDHGNICMGYPIIVIDCYEHSYFMDYGTEKDKYVNNFMKCIDWQVVERRINKVT